jgi:hypothetical protein
MWDAKTEPGVVDIFEQIWGTDKLTVSFGTSISFLYVIKADTARWRKLFRPPPQGTARRWWSALASHGSVPLEAATRLYSGYLKLITQRSQGWWIDCRHWVDKVLQGDLGLLQG